MAEVKTRLFNRCAPLVPAGDPVRIKVNQTLEKDRQLLDTSKPDEVTLKVDGPRFQLTPGDIAGVYPAPGSDDSPDEFLPHIALNRRTLPWERSGPGQPNPQPLPWLALLVVKESELRSAEALKKSPGPTLEHLAVKDIEARDGMTYKRLREVLKLADATRVHAIFISNRTLMKILPLREELPLLCHMKRVITRVPAERPGEEPAYKDVVKDTAIVIANRLPDAGPDNGKPEIHTALLVSLEQRDDLYDVSLPASVALIVLHHWTFVPSRGGDFEQVIRAISLRPNGGALRFGNLPAPARAGAPAPLSGPFDAVLDDDGYLRDPLSHTTLVDGEEGTREGKALYRGPLRPFPAPPRSEGIAIRAAPEEFDEAGSETPLDMSHAAAFEFGRLLALNDPGILEDLHHVHAAIDPIAPEILVSPLPPGLAKRDWISNPEWAAWVESPWAAASGVSLIKAGPQFLADAGEAQVTGIEESLREVRGAVLQQLTDMGAPTPALATPVNIDIATGESLAKQFGDVFTAGIS